MHRRLNMPKQRMFIVSILLTALAVVLAIVTVSIRQASASGGPSIGTPITRSEVIARANNWFTRSPALTYNESRAASTLVADVGGVNKYGPDCSGMVSMAWRVVPGSGGGFNTSTLPSVATAISNRATIQRGDVLIDTYGSEHHAILFDSWQSDHVHFSYYSFGSTPMRHYDGGTQGNHGPLGSFTSGTYLAGLAESHYLAYQYKNITNDTSRGAPQTVAQANGTVDVFWRGTDNNIWHDWYTVAGGWFGPTRMTSAGNVTADPSPVLSSSGTIDVFWKGSDSNLWHIWYTTADGWNPAQNLGQGPLNGSPQAVGQSDGSINVFWRGTTNNIWSAAYTVAAGWVGPTPLTTSGNMVSDPSPAISSPGTIDVFWKGVDTNLWHILYTTTTGSWTTEQSLGDGTLGGAPEAIGQSDGTMNVFWRGTDNNIWGAVDTVTGGWAGPARLTTTANVSSDPTPVVSSTGTVDVFWQATSTGNLWHVWYTTVGGWENPQNLGEGKLNSAPFAASQPNGTIDVFWKGTDFNLWHGWYTASSGWNGPTRLTTTSNMG